MGRIRGWSGLVAAAVSACGLGSGPPSALRCEGTQRPVNCFLAMDGGTFWMGAQSTDRTRPRFDPDARPDEGPVRQVTVAPFWIQAEEVQLSQWEACVRDGRCPSVEGRGPVDGMGAMKGVAAQVTWAEADAFCRSLGARLPTEAEWEFVARAGDDRRYPWGEATPCALGQSEDRWSQTPPGHRDVIPGCAPDAPSARDGSAIGVQDLGWGHWEWVQDWYAPYPASGGAGGPEHGTRKVQRGGSWSAADPIDHRTSARQAMPPDTRVFDVGMRCAW